MSRVMATELPRFEVPAHPDGEKTAWSLDAAVREGFSLSWGKARSAIETGKITVDGAVVLEIQARVRKGAVIVFNERARKPSAARDLPPGAIVVLDAHVVVVEKPSGISTIPFDDTETGTLDERVRAFLSKKMSKGERPQLGVVHRIDKETSGLVVFTRSWMAKQSLSNQFRVHTVHRKYFAIVHGNAESKTIRSHLISNRGDGLRGSLEKKGKGPRGGFAEEGQLAISHIQVEEKLNGATLISCRLETGRTHQIRVHLSEDGHPLVGERVYSRHFAGPEIPAPRLMLHAAELGFVHPKTEEEVRFTSPLPKDFEETLARLR